MNRTKEELQRMNVELEGRLSELRSDFYNIRKERDNLQEEVEDKQERINKLINQIHFLAGMLYKEGVDIEGCDCRIDVIIKKPELPVEKQPIYTYCSK